MKTILPGQPGSKRFVDKYGKKLVCVRYKYDEERKQKQITVELIETEKKWEKNNNRIPNNKIVPVRVAINETDLRIKVKSLGGKWNTITKCWELPYKYIKAFGLEKRIFTKGYVK